MPATKAAMASLVACLYLGWCIVHASAVFGASHETVSIAPDAIATTLQDQTAVWSSAHPSSSGNIPPATTSIEAIRAATTRVSQSGTTPPSQEQEETLLDWAARQWQDGPPKMSDQTADPVVDTSNNTLVVGVKTSVLHNFQNRQAIRQTWALPNNTQARGVRVIFLGCEPDLSTYHDSTAAWTKAVALEKATFGDLLTSELGCQDSYRQLVQKTMGFMHWVVTKAGSSLAYVMVVDDDIYLHIPRLLAMLDAPTTPTRRFYGGLVWSKKPPVRNPAHKYYISPDQYPMNELPSFATGAHYILSLDVAQFLARNVDDLRGLSSLDDVSVALWLLAMQVHPVHIDSFEILQRGPCRDELVSLADLSPWAIRHLHDNVVYNRSLCGQLPSTMDSLRTFRSLILPDLDPFTGEDDEQQQQQHHGDALFKWTLQRDIGSHAVQIAVTVTVDDQAISFTYAPSQTTHHDGFCVPAVALVHEKMFVNVNTTTFCKFHQRALVQFLDKVVHDSPSMLAFLTLARHNVMRGKQPDSYPERETASSPPSSSPSPSSSSPFIVALSPGAKFSRVFIECVFVEMYPERVVLVLDGSSGVDLTTPHVVVLSILDLGWATATGRPDAAEFANRFSSTSQVILISGEAWPIDNLDPRVVLLSTVAATSSPDHQQHHHPKQLYLPVASSAFGETVQHSPLELLQP